MADLVNPYKNPYLPSFVNQQPRFEAQRTVPGFGSIFNQIHPVNGFNGAREYAANLANGSSEILSESDPEIARIYIVAKDQNGNTIMQPFGLIPVEEPKPITMEDLNTKMSELLDRMNKLEEERANDKSNNGTAGKAPRSWTDAKHYQNNGGDKVSSKPASSDSTVVTE